MHRKVKRHEIGLLDWSLLERLDRQIQALDLDPRLAKKRGGRRQPERLAPQFIGRDQEDLHSLPPPALSRRHR